MSKCPHCHSTILKLIRIKKAIIYINGLAEYVPYHLCPKCKKEIEGISTLKEARDFLKAK